MIWSIIPKISVWSHQLVTQGEAGKMRMPGLCMLCVLKWTIFNLMVAWKSWFTVGSVELVLCHVQPIWCVPGMVCICIMYLNVPFRYGEMYLRVWQKPKNFLLHGFGISMWRQLPKRLSMKVSTSHFGVLEAVQKVIPTPWRSRQEKRSRLNIWTSFFRKSFAWIVFINPNIRWNRQRNCIRIGISAGLSEEKTGDIITAISQFIITGSTRSWTGTVVRL